MGIGSGDGDDLQGIPFDDPRAPNQKDSSSCHPFYLFKFYSTWQWKFKLSSGNHIYNEIYVEKIFLVTVTLTFDLLTSKSIGFFPFPSIYISFVWIGWGKLKLRVRKRNVEWQNGGRNDGKANSIALPPYSTSFDRTASGFSSGYITHILSKAHWLHALNYCNKSVNKPIHNSEHIRSRKFDIKLQNLALTFCYKFISKYKKK